MGFSLGKALGGLLGGLGGLLGGGLGGDIEDFFFGKEGELKTERVPLWTPEQFALFNRLYKRWMRGGLAPTAEELAYRRFLSRYEPWYRKTVEGIWSPEAAKQQLETFLPAWRETALPEIQSAYAGPGYWGSARAEAVRRSLNELERDVLGRSILARQQALSGLLQTLPLVKAELARISSPWASPAFEAALRMLGLSPYAVLGGMTESMPGLIQSLIGGAGQGLGMYGGFKLGKAIGIV